MQACRTGLRRAVEVHRSAWHIRTVPYTTRCYTLVYTHALVLTCEARKLGRESDRPSHRHRELCPDARWTSGDRKRRLALDQLPQVATLCPRSALQARCDHGRRRYGMQG